MLAATAAAATAAARHSTEDGAALCGPEGGKAARRHTLYVAGSTSGRGLRETVVDVPKEVPLPGRPGRIDAVAFGPAWVVVAKEVRMGDVWVIVFGRSVGRSIVWP